MADRTVVYRFEGKVDGLKSQLAAAGTSVKNFGDELTGLDRKGEQMRAGLTTIGSAATKTGLVVAGGLALAAKSSMDWEVAWTGVLKTVDGTPAQLAKLEDGLRGLAKETGFAHGEVAAVAEAAGQLGISIGGIEDFTKTMLDMGVSTNLSAEEAATGLARFRNIMGITEPEIQNTGSAMVELGNNFATTEGEILAMSLRVAGAGRQAGLSTSDVLGLSAAMSSVGIEAEAGGTAISMTMKRIGKEVETSGDSLDLFAQVAGMSADEFQQAWGQDAAGTLQRFVAGLSDTERIGMSTNAVLRELGVTGIREADSLLRLSGNAEGLADALATANEGFTANIALTEESGKFYATTSQQAKQAWADIKDAAIDAGESMLPVIVAVADAVGTVAGAWQMLPDDVQTAVVAFAAFVAVSGLALGAFARVVGGVASMRQAYADLGLSVDKARAGVVGFATSARAGAGLLLVADQMTGLSEKAGMANTATYALMGTMLAPGWGTAAGALIGYFMDISSANDEIEKSIARSNKTMSDASGFADIRAGAESARAALRDYKAEADLSGLDLLNPFKTIAGMKSLVGDDLSKFNAQVRDLSTLAYDAEKNAGLLASALGEVGDVEAVPLKGLDGEVIGQYEQVTYSVEQLDAAAKAASVAMANLGIDKALGELSVDEIKRVADEIKRMDSEAGRVEDLGAAFSGLESDMSSTADAAKALGDALDALLGPAMNQERAMLAWKESLGALKDDLAENDRSLDKNSKAGRQNREVILDRIDALNETVVADAGAGASQEQLSRKMRNGRKTILDSAEAAGLNRGEVKKMVDQMGLTPEMIRTLIRLDGAEKAKAEVTALKSYLDSIPAWKSTTIRVGWSVATNPLGAMLNPASVLTRASGGPIYGPGTETSDSIPALLSHNEHVWSAREVRAIGGHDAMERARAMARAGALRFANGGTPAGSGFNALLASSSMFGATAAARSQQAQQAQLIKALSSVSMFGDRLTKGVDRLDNSLKGLRQQLKSHEKRLGDLKDDRSDLRSSRDSLISAIQSNYRTSLFQAPDNIWSPSASMDPRATLRGDLESLGALNKARAAISGKGVKSGALDALLQEGSLADLQAMAGWSKRELKDYSRLYAQREQALGDVSSAAGASAYGAELKVLNKALDRQRQETKEARQALNRMEKHLAEMKKDGKTAPKRTGAAVASAKRGQAARAGRNAR